MNPNKKSKEVTAVVAEEVAGTTGVEGTQPSPTPAVSAVVADPNDAAKLAAGLKVEPAPELTAEERVALEAEKAALLYTLNAKAAVETHAPNTKPAVESVKGATEDPRVTSILNTLETAQANARKQTLAKAEAFQEADREKIAPGVRRVAREWERKWEPRVAAYKRLFALSARDWEGLIGHHYRLRGLRRTLETLAAAYTIPSMAGDILDRIERLTSLNPGEVMYEQNRIIRDAQNLGHWPWTVEVELKNLKSVLNDFAYAFEQGANVGGPVTAVLTNKPVNRPPKKPSNEGVTYAPEYLEKMAKKGVQL
jgi:hypothetical protein